ncbi:hypothetical protein SEA_HITCHHIKER_23 [Microbacterium phage HitchHiker]
MVHPDSRNFDVTYLAPDPSELVPNEPASGYTVGTTVTLKRNGHTFRVAESQRDGKYWERVVITNTFPVNDKE